MASGTRYYKAFYSIPKLRYPKGCRKTPNKNRDSKGKEMLFSQADLEIITQNPLQDFRSTYRQFFFEKTDLTVEKVQEKPEILKLILNDATTEENSRELFHVFLLQLSLTDAGGELRHPTGSDTIARKQILLFAGEWPNQLDLGADALNLCADASLKALAPEKEVPDRDVWSSMYNLLAAFPAVDSPDARKHVAIMAKDYVVKYAKEHPYLLAFNIGLSLVGFAVPPLLGVLGFTGAGVGAGTAAAAWQSTFLGFVPKGSLFAACQSIAATGSAPLVSTAGWAASSVITGATAMWDGIKGDKKDRKDKTGSKEEEEMR
ncbi:hypothetical protein L873DRAFT_1665462 [Choiromyces venosus 120613-1]|uniref:Uncharacterized protein n=1 Tax=Choiromyces venosus 120613-1 TaxID=1336337 RepID=A0A3N4K8P1_9PEZI|nr:hypothetical protein L873DRAFT_1665462 [Choiromyces venosus 120613-1]